MTSTKIILALTVAAAVLGATAAPTAAFAHGGGMGGDSHMGMPNGGQVGSQLGHIDQHIDRDDRHTHRDDRHRDQTKNVPVDTFHVFVTDLQKFIKKLRMEGFRVVKIQRVVVNGNAVADISAVKVGGPNGTGGAL